MHKRLLHALIFGICMGTVGSFVGLFIGLQVAPIIGTIFLFPGIFLVTLLVDGLGLSLIIIIQIIWWFALFSLVRFIRDQVRKR